METGMSAVQQRIADIKARAASNGDAAKPKVEEIKSAQPVEIEQFVYMTDMGHLYKGVSPKSPGDASKPFATPDMLAVLTDIPCPQEEMVKRIIELGNKRTAAVLEPVIPNPVSEIDLGNVNGL